MNEFRKLLESIDKVIKEGIDPNRFGYWDDGSPVEADDEESMAELQSMIDAEADPKKKKRMERKFAKIKATGGFDDTEELNRGGSTNFRPEY